VARELQLALKNYREHMEEREFPACFTEEEFSAWKLHEAEIPTQPIRRFACRDCTRVYQKEMTIQGRCPNSSINIEKVVD